MHANKACTTTYMLAIDLTCSISTMKYIHTYPCLHPHLPEVHQCRLAHGEHDDDHGQSDDSPCALCGGIGSVEHVKGALWQACPWLMLKGSGRQQGYGWADFDGKGSN